MSEDPKERYRQMLKLHKERIRLLGEKKQSWYRKKIAALEAFTSNRPRR